jgi:hypothetical protein
MARRGNPNPGPGENIRTYTVDQLLEQAKMPDAAPQQMYGEIERRARLWDECHDENDS